MVFVWEETP